LENKVIKKVPYERIEQLHYSKDGKYFITGTKYEGKPKVTLWDANTLESIRDYEVPEGNDNGFRKIQISDNNKLIGLATSNTDIVKILETETGNVVKTSDNNQNGLNFSLLFNDFYLIYQENDITNYGMYFYRYPDIFQSSLMRDGSRIIISKKTDEDKIVIFQETYKGIALLKSSTTSVSDILTNQFKIRVDSEKITVSFENADSIKIIDMNGKILLDQKVNEPIITIPNTFIPGTYICLIKSGDREYSQKFQVVR
jgi:WD40 repeat protein